MAREYMSHTETTQWIYVNAAILIAKQIIEEQSGGKSTDKTILADVKRGVAFLERARNARTAALNDKGKAKLYREASLYTVGLIHAPKAEKHKAKMFLADREIREQVVKEHGRDPVLDMAEQLLQLSCKRCTGGPMKQEGGCWIHNTYQLLDIEPWDTDHAECPYAGAGIVEEGA